MSSRLLFFSIVAVVTLTFPQVIRAGEPVKKTPSKDAAAKDRLLGKHRLTLQWISFQSSAGEAEVREEEGVLRIKGEQREAKTGNYLTIDGTIELVDSKSFTFVGTIVTR